MFGFRSRERTANGPGPVDHSNMFVRGIDPVNVEKAWGNKRSRAGLSGWRTFAQQFDLEAAFLTRFAKGCSFRVFVQLDVPPQRQPLV